MDNENDLLAFFGEVLEMRVLNRSDSSRLLPEVVEISKEIMALMESVTDEKVRNLLYNLEELKNDHSSIVIDFMYRAGVNDVVRLLQLIFKTLFRGQ